MKARWLLDTCVVCELFKPEPDMGLRAWVESNVPGCRLSAVTLGEITYGVEILPHGRRRNALQRWADQLRQQYLPRTLVTDESVWMAFGRLKASLRSIGRPQDDMDVLVGATAVVHDLELVTRNTRHFRDMGVALINPWSA